MKQEKRLARNIAEYVTQRDLSPFDAAFTAVLTMLTDPGCAQDVLECLKNKPTWDYVVVDLTEDVAVIGGVVAPIEIAEWNDNPFETVFKVKEG